jgi:hypothetical protein
MLYKGEKFDKYIFKNTILRVIISINIWNFNLNNSHRFIAVVGVEFEWLVIDLISVKFKFINTCTRLNNQIFAIIINQY